MDRAMASIQRCSSTRPIDGADKIEVATVLGWECVVKKGEIKPGELGVYIEIDAVVPDTPVFEFLRERKFRVRTIRLRGQISQGLFLPLSYFPGILVMREGLDVSKILGITQYEPEEPKTSSAPKKHPWWFYILVRIPLLRRLVLRKVGTGSAFPTHLVPKTDETRLQAFGEGFLETYRDIMVSISQKMDGTSLTIIWNRGTLSVCSRNVWFPTYKSNVYWNFVRDSGLLAILKKAKLSPFAIQGELCGPALQGNKYKLTEKVLYIYGVYDIKKQVYLPPAELRFFVDSLTLSYGWGNGTVKIVPQLGDSTIGMIGSTVDEWVKFATTKSDLNPDTYNEGIVVRSLDNKPYAVKDMNGRRFSFKVVSPEFLLQWNE